MGKSLVCCFWLTVCTDEAILRPLDCRTDRAVINWGGSGLHLAHGSLETSDSIANTASRSVHPFLQGTRPWPTDRHKHAEKHGRNCLPTSAAPIVLLPLCHWRQPRRGCRRHIPQYFAWGDVNGNIPPILLRTFGYSRPILVALRSLSLKPISFGYKTPPIRVFPSHTPPHSVVRPPNLELALTTLHCALEQRPCQIAQFCTPMSIHADILSLKPQAYICEARFANSNARALATLSLTLTVRLCRGGVKEWPLVQWTTRPLPYGPDENQ